MEHGISTPSEDLCPWMLKMATRGYYIQSKILHIPDLLGFISPGPPSLQVFDLGDFIGLLLCLSLQGTIEALVLIHSWLYEYFWWKLAYFFLMNNCVFFFFWWIITCHGRHFKSRCYEEFFTASTVVEEKVRDSDELVEKEYHS
ncbi:hypothetical protein FACUT_8924 [Fusarium acutatum]|uniref:Uncharacterized protein n=1 Tax=Fusarium acutatum TaxID=78861 RepID=A0A8H4ND82_9HYPO|nr:hypothetical protein FACUT_8924 [Fusarium acutatum]